MESLSAEQLSQFPWDKQVWVIIDKADPDNYLRIPMNLDYKLSVFAFLEKADADHLVRIMKKEDDFEIRQVPLRKLDRSILGNDTPLTVLDSENAMDYFTRYPDMLEKYYGY